MKKKSILFLALGIISLSLGVALDVTNVMFSGTMNSLFSHSEVDESLKKAALEKGYALNTKLEEEGATLLKNDGILPLKNTKKVNTYGLGSAHLVLNGSGSGASNDGNSATLKDSLEKAGFEINSKLWELASKTQLETSLQVNENGGSPAIGENPVSVYSGDISFASAKSFSDVAIVTISRSGGEGFDCTRAGLDGNKGYLELSKEEEDLFKSLNDNNFKVIVLINSSYPLDCSFIKAYNPQAVLWVGGVGSKGALAIGSILNGSVNPSGHLPDTWIYNKKFAPNYYATGKHSILDSENNNVISGNTDYNEGIYMGYRFYETADAEGLLDSPIFKNLGAINGYDDVVSYPFGYGLSYSKFDRKISIAKEDDKYVEFKVESKNIDSTYSGKDVFQLYVEKPYYEGGIEKAKVELVDFEKTDIIKPNDGYSTTIRVEKENLASYDETADSNKGAYVLDKGAYTFYLGDNAHSWKDIDSDCKVSINVNNTITYNESNKRESDKVVATNQLVGTDTHNGEKIDILSRKNHFANALTSCYTEKEEKKVTKGSEVYNNLASFAYNNNFSKYKGEVLQDVEFSKKSNLTIDDLMGASYDDPRWMELVSKMSIDEAIKLLGSAGWKTEAVKSVGKKAMEDIDGPFGFSNYIKTSAGVKVENVSYCSEPVIAATFNKELIKEFGETLGDEANADGYGGMYAPGLNLHRTQFGGRNPEYYSEDPILSGKLAQQQISGLSSKGIYTYMKHFAFNDIEANRTARQVCIVNEQTARELYLKPFELACKNDSGEGENATYSSSAVMVSYMWLGEKTWCGNNSNLMVNILRKEWGFKGSAITDNAIGLAKRWLNLKNALLGGTDLVLTAGQEELTAEDLNTKECKSAIKLACKNVLYTYSTSARRTVPLVDISNAWPIIFIAGNVLFYALFATFAALTVVSLLKDKKNK